MLNPSTLALPNPSILGAIVSEILLLALVALIKNIYTLWGRKRFLLPVTYFPTNLGYPFTLRVTGIKTTRKNAIAEYLDYQIPVTQLKGPKRIGDLQAAKRD